MDRESIDFINKVIADQTEKFFKFSVLHNKYLFRTQMGSEQLHFFLDSFLYFLYHIVPCWNPVF